MKLPIPEKAYPDWSRLLSAAWLHGMSVKHVDPKFVQEACDEIPTLIFEAMTQRNEAQMTRPSSGLACARQTFYNHQGHQMDPMPDNIGTTFAIGHTLHQLSYAAVLSAMPDCFAVEVEKSVALPTWWPTDEKLYNQKGTVDMFIRIKNPEEASAYLSDEAPKHMLIDFKTMGGYSFRKHGKALFGEDPDGFGYMSQLTVYADSPDIDCVESGAIIAGINRDSLAQPLKPRLVDSRVLQAERQRLQAALEMAVEGNDPGEEFLLRHDDEANFFCGRAGKPGYCGHRVRCRDEPTR